jgi:hypothetical protein
MIDWPQGKQMPWRAAVSALPGRVGNDIRLSKTETSVFLYAATADDAMRAEQAAREVLAKHDVSADFRLDLWDAVNEMWRDVTAEPPGQTREALRDEHEYLMDLERQRSAATGRAMWQVRVDLRSRDEVEMLARHLQAKGCRVVRRRRYLIAGADCEDDANALAQEIGGYTSTGTVIRIQRGVYGLPPIGEMAPLSSCRRNSGPLATAGVAALRCLRAVLLPLPSPSQTCKHSKTPTPPTKPTSTGGSG